MQGIAIELSKLIATGGFADVVRVGNSRVVKIFRRPAGSNAQSSVASDDEIIWRAVCEAQCDAYELIAKHSHLTKFVPAYFGKRTIASVLSSELEDVSGAYLLNCAYELAFVPGNECKIGYAQGLPIAAELNRVVSLLHSIGVNETHDGSVIVSEDNLTFAIIDFSTYDALADIGYRLASGENVDELRARWGRRGSA